MSGRLSEAELARLLALPEDHPDRLRAAALPEFEAMRRMLDEFEREPAPSASADAAGTRLELRRRLERAGVLKRPATSIESGWRDALSWLGRPAARATLVFATIVLVAGAGWWSLESSRREHAMRGSAEPGAFQVSGVGQTTDEVSLHWTPVPGADEYRVTFLGSDLSEIARRDGLRGTELVLGAGRLPAGLVARSEVSIEVVALRHGDPIATTPARSIRLP